MVGLLVALAIGSQLPQEQAANADATAGTEHYRFAFLFHSQKAADVRIEAYEPTILCWAAYDPMAMSAMECEDAASGFDGQVHHYTVTVECHGDSPQTKTGTLDTDSRVVVVSVTCE